MQLQKSRFDYKWVILCVSFLMVFICLGFCSSNKGLYLSAITESLNIKRSLFSINDSCRYIASVLANLLFSTFVYRFGVRKMTAFGFLTLISSMLAYTYADHILEFYIGGALLGFGLAFTSTAMSSCIVRRWFNQNVGRYTGIVLAANGIGGAFAAQIISPIINQEDDPFGYRDSYLLVALILLVVGILVVLLLREYPKNTVVGAVPAKKKTRGANWSGIPYAQAKKKSYFYITAVIILLTGMILQGVYGTYAAHMKDIGLNAGHIATVASILALLLTGTKILVGMLFDRHGLRVVMTLCQTITVIAFVLMILIDNSDVGNVLSIIFAVLFSLALPLETIAIPLITNGLFGSVSYDKILGIYIAMLNAGFALGAPIMNLVYDEFGSYKPIHYVFCGMMMVISVITQFVLKRAQKDKDIILKESQQ